MSKVWFARPENAMTGMHLTALKVNGWKHEHLMPNIFSCLWLCENAHAECRAACRVANTRTQTKFIKKNRVVEQHITLKVCFWWVSLLTNM